jgi:CHAD domain-containing protein
MSFQFKNSELPVKAVRRVWRECADDARRHLRESDRSAAIHDVRKEIKKLRAVFRLVRGEIARDDYRKNVKALRKVANYLAVPRDARVMLKAFDKLIGRSTRRFGEIEKILRKYRRRETHRFQRGDAATMADEILRKATRRMGKLDVAGNDWAAIEPGLKKSYRRGREAHNVARQKPSPENFHEWRKHVKDLGYYFQLFCRAWPPELRATTEGLKLLGEQLGEDHDLFLLKQFAVEHCAAHAGEVAKLNRLIRSRQKELSACALDLGSRLYAASPAVFCRRLENVWENWQDETARRKQKRRSDESKRLEQKRG